jgi:O-antigen/teichoic acid export membrane protein
MPVIAIIAGAQLLELYTYLCRAVFRTYERMEIEGISFVLEGILKVLLFSVLVKTLNVNILLIAEMLIISNLAVLLFSIYLTKAGFIIPGFLFDFRLWRELIARTLPFALLFFFGVINFKIDIIMVSAMMGDALTGWYSAGVRLIESILIVPISIAAAFFPAFSSSHKNSRENLRPLFKKALETSLFTGISIIIILNLLSGCIINFTFGSNYLNSASVLRILSLTLAPFFVKFFLERFILSLEISKIIFISYFLGTALNIFLNIVFGRLFGLRGIALATLISEIFIVSSNLLYLRLRFQPAR